MIPSTSRPQRGALSPTLLTFVAGTALVVAAVVPLSQAAEPAAGPGSNAGSLIRTDSSMAGARDFGEITPDRLDRVLAVLSPLSNAAKLRAHAQQAQERYAARVDRFEKCMAVAQPPLTIVVAPLSIEVRQQASDYASRVAVLQTRTMRAESEHDSLTALRLADSVDLLNQRALALLNPRVALCGPRPQRPAAVPALPSTETSIRAHGFTRRDFGRLRDRVAAWVLGDGAPSSSAVAALGPFTDHEHSTLRARERELMALKPVLRDGALPWVRVNDIP